MSNETKHSNTWIIMYGIFFIILLLTFCQLDKYIKLRHIKILAVAIRTNRIISTLFPKTVRDRVIEEAKEAEMQEANNEKMYQAPKQYLKTILDSGTLLDNRSLHNTNSEELTDKELHDIMYRTKPIADLFPETTILFADIAGFTAWSSVREPSQVFVLLETTYMTLDDLAKRRHVFKVETVGDCYVAATGLPDPRKDHAGKDNIILFCIFPPVNFWYMTSYLSK
jgi:Adenylate and Guanylate cyclase catalytic domain